MDEESWYESDAEWQRRASGPFGELDRESRGRLQASSEAVMHGAQNLLTKAILGWRDDRARALGYVDRVARMPFDEHEESFPAAAAASYLLFSLVVDAMEKCPEGDIRWLDAAVVALAEASTTARFHLRDVLSAIDHDYGVSGDEQRVLRGAVKPIPPRAELRDMTDLDVGQLRDEVSEVVALCVAYLDALEAVTND